MQTPEMSVADQFARAIQKVSDMELRIQQLSVKNDAADKRLTEQERTIRQLSDENVTLRKANDRFKTRADEVTHCLRLGARLFIDVAKGDPALLLELTQYAPKSREEREVSTNGNGSQVELKPETEQELAGIVKKIGLGKVAQLQRPPQED